MVWDANERRSLVWVGAVCLLVSVLSGCMMGSGSKELVENAYALRMNGKSDEAKELLEASIKENPRDAASHYELARTMIHMALGNPRVLEENLTEAVHLTDLAVENDPKNVEYRCLAGLTKFFLAYMALQGDSPDVKEKVAEVCQAFESALELKPDYHDAILYLVELYGVIPEEMGGNRQRADQYAADLEAQDAVLGMKARSIIGEVSSGDWAKLRETHPANTAVLEELGKAYLAESREEEAAACFEEAVGIDPGRATLFLDLGRYYVLSARGAMRSDNKESVRAKLAAAETAIGRFLESQAPPPLKAYAFGMLAKVKRGLGEEEEMNRHRENAEALDPHYSKATGSPRPELFVPPGALSDNHRYLLRPL